MSTDHLSHEALLCLKTVERCGPIAYGVSVHESVKQELGPDSLYRPMNTFMHLRHLAGLGYLIMLIEFKDTPSERTSWQLTDSGREFLSQLIPSKDSTV